MWTTTVNPIGGPFSDALRIAFHDYAWILALLGIEVLRQFHYLIEEHSKGYYRFWQKTVFGSAARRMGKMDDWTRFRAARAFKAFIFLLALSTFLGRIFKTDPVWFGLLDAPGRLVTALPFVFQLSFGFLFIIIQFGGLFWFLSRGGIDTYMPDDLETRFSDVKGQDPVLERVQENMIFLDDPESIEDRGGYVPGGLLLWGPPGTGKTLMAQAVAGETAKPFVFVDPGAFTQMFMGVGILKVKSLYRKLRKLAVRYGGVIVFFDEADSLGNRGSLGTQGGGWNFGASGGSALDPGCNGLAYLAPASRDAIVRSEMGAAQGPNKDPIFMGGMGGGGGMGTLQALLSAMSGLKKPRGFINRYVRRLLGMKPKPPPKYRILHIFATNMPQALDEAMLRPGRIDRIYKVGLPVEGGPQVHVRLLLREGAARAHAGRHRQARHHDAVRDRREHPGHGERGARDRDPRRTGGHQLGRRHASQAAEGARAPRRQPVREPGATRGGDPRGVARRGRVPHTAPHGDRHGDDRASRRHRRLRLVDPARGPVRPVALGARGRHHREPGVARRRTTVLRR